MNEITKETFELYEKEENDIKNREEFLFSKNAKINFFSSAESKFNIEGLDFSN